MGKCLQEKEAFRHAALIVSLVQAKEMCLYRTFQTTVINKCMCIYSLTTNSMEKTGCDAHVVSRQCISLYPGLYLPGFLMHFSLCVLHLYLKGF